MSNPWAIFTREASTAVLRECGYEVKAMTNADLLERLDDQGLYSKAERIQMIKDAAAEIRRLRASGHGAGREADIELAKQCVTVAAFACDEQSRKLLYAVAKHLQTPVALERTAGREERQRIHNLRVTLSSIFTLAQDAPASPKTMKAIRVAAKRALDRDHQSAAPSPDDQR